MMANWTPAQSWAYALGAPYHVQHKVPVDALPHRKGFGSTRGQSATMLKRDWAIETAEDMLRMLNWLGVEGHRHPYGIAMRRYSMMRRPAIAARREELRDAGRQDTGALKELWRLDAAQANLDGMLGSPLIAFDAARAVMLARCAWQMDWLSEAQLWDYLLDLARDVHRCLSSWDEYAADYRRSRNMWRAGNQPDMFDAIVDGLSSGPSGQWRRLAWDEPGLAVPRPPRPFDVAAPIWSLESWTETPAP